MAEELVSERGRYYWIDGEGERISPTFDTEHDAWVWLDGED